jgi:hypothetical protein
LSRRRRQLRQEDRQILTCKIIRREPATVGESLSGFVKDQLQKMRSLIDKHRDNWEEGRAKIKEMIDRLYAACSVDRRAVVELIIRVDSDESIED